MAGPAVTRIDVVVDHLVQLLATTTGLQVTDGMHIGEIMAEAICVGFTESAEHPAYETTLERSPGMGRPRMTEKFTVRLFLTISSGEADIKTLRARAAALLGMIDSALRDDHRHPGIWDRAILGSSVDWVPVLDASGALCNVFFTIDGESLL